LVIQDQHAQHAATQQQAGAPTLHSHAAPLCNSNQIRQTCKRNHYMFKVCLSCSGHPSDKRCSAAWMLPVQTKLLQRQVAPLRKLPSQQASAGRASARRRATQRPPPHRALRRLAGGAGAASSPARERAAVLARSSSSPSSAAAHSTTSRRPYRCVPATAAGAAAASCVVRKSTNAKPLRARAPLGTARACSRARVRHQVRKKCFWRPQRAS